MLFLFSNLLLLVMVETSKEQTILVVEKVIVDREHVETFGTTFETTPMMCKYKYMSFLTPPMSPHRIAVFSELTDPIGIVVDAVLILAGDIPITLVWRAFAMRVLEMGLEIVCSGERCSLATTNPALVQTMVILFVHSFLVPLLMLLAFEAFLLTSLLVDAARVTASKLVLGNDDFTVNARASFVTAVDRLRLE